MPIYRIFDEEQVNNIITAGDQQNQQVTPLLRDGGWVVTWQSFDENNENPRLYQQAYAASGSKVGIETLIGSQTGSQQNHQVTPLATGGWLVTWDALGTAQGDNGIEVFQQLFSPTGVALGEQTRVNTYISESQEFAKVTTLIDGRWVAVWQSTGLDGSGNGLAQRVFTLGPDGVATAFNEARVNFTNTSGNQTGIEITPLLNGGWVVTWLSPGTDGQDDIYQQVFSATGGRVGPETRVNTHTPNSQSFQKITPLGFDRWVVTWVSDGQDGPGDGVYQQVYELRDGTVAPVGEETLVNTTEEGDQNEQQVTVLFGGQRWVVTWSDDRDGDGASEVYQQAYQMNGAEVETVGEETLVNSFTDGDQGPPTVKPLSNGGWVVAWTSGGGQDGDGVGVFQQVFAPNGTKVGSERQVNSHFQNYQGGPQVANLQDGWVVTWLSDQQDGGGYGIYQRRYQEIQTLGAGSEYAAGTESDDTFDVVPGGLTDGDTLEGGDGSDTVRLTAAGTLDITAPAVFTGIERLLGSNGEDLFLVSNERLGGVLSIDGGGDDDSIRILDDADLSDVIVTNVERIELLAGVDASFDDAATAVLATSATEDTSLTLIGDTFSSAELAQLFRQGVRMIADESGAYVYAPFEIRGEFAAQTTAMDVAVTPFADVVLTGSTGLQVTATVTFQAVRGELKNITRGDYNVATGTYTVTGTAEDVQAALRALRFDPRDRADAIGATETTQLRLTITDDVVSAPIERTVDITSRATNLAPGEPSLSRSAVQENAKAGTVVGDVLVVDPNPQDPLTLTLTNDAGGRFELVGGKLLVKAGAVLDFERARSHEVTIKAADAGGLTVEKTLRVDVADVLVEQIRGTVRKDVLKGGLGQDAFVFDVRPTKRNVDKLESFVVKDDSVWLENAFYKGLGRKGSLDKPQGLTKDGFFTGTKAGDAEDRIIYDRKSGKLYYDEDGTGAKAQVLIAQMQKGLRLNEKDFFVI